MRTRAVYLLGAPATGKSTVMRAALDRLGWAPGEEVRQPWPVRNTEFRLQPLVDVIGGREVGVSLGVDREGGFPGTDALGLACQPDAVGWVTESEELPPVIVGEGMRLGTTGFLGPLAVRSRLLVMHLTAPQQVLDERCEARGSSQAASFRKTGATRALRTAEYLRSHGVTVLDTDTSVWPAEVVADEVALHLS